MLFLASVTGFQTLHQGKVPFTISPVSSYQKRSHSASPMSPGPLEDCLPLVTFSSAGDFLAPPSHKQRMGAFHITRPLKIQTERNFLSSVTFLQRQKSRLTWLQVTLLQPVGVYQGNSSGNLTRHAPASYSQTLSQTRMCGFERKYGEEGHTSGRKANANLELNQFHLLPELEMAILAAGRSSVSTHLPLRLGIPDLVLGVFPCTQLPTHAGST